MWHHSWLKHYATNRKLRVRIHMRSLNLFSLSKPPRRNSQECLYELLNINNEYTMKISASETQSYILKMYSFFS
jgi:hypothetical protein